MGDLNALKTGIRNEAEDRAARILQKARDGAAEAMQEAEAVAGSRRQGILQDGRREADSRKRRIEIASELDFRRGTLGVRQKLVSEAVDLALQKIQALSLDRRAGLFVRMLLESAEKGNEEIRPAAGDRALLESLLSQVNQELQKKGRLGALRVGSTDPGIDGGFILVGDHYRVDNSLKTLVMSMKDDLIPEVARILFQ